MPSQRITTPMRAILPDKLREQMVVRVMLRDRLTESHAKAVVIGLSIADLTRLELETRERVAPLFSADYDPYARA